MRKLTAFIVALLLTTQVYAAEEDGKQQIRDHFESLGADIKVQSIDASPVPGLYEVSLSTGEVLYASKDGKHVLAGPLYRFDGKGLENLTEQRLSALRVKALATIPADERVIFKPKGEVKARLQVFTDVDCPYCRQLNAHVPQLTALGVQVEYLAYPRQGMNSAAAKKMSAIWCAPPKQRPELMNKAKRGARLSSVSCDSPIQKELELGQRLGVRGTPSLITEDGRMVPGYLNVEQIRKLLKI